MTILFARHEPTRSEIVSKYSRLGGSIALYNDLLCMKQSARIECYESEYPLYAARPRKIKNLRLIWLPPVPQGSPRRLKRKRYSKQHYIENRQTGIAAVGALALARDSVDKPSNSSWRSREFYPYDCPASGKPGDDYRWIENPRACGLRFSGYCDEINDSIRHQGWNCDDDGSRTLRGVIYQLPTARDGTMRFLYGYECSDTERSAYLCMTSEEVRLPDEAHGWNEDDCRDEVKWQLRKIAHAADRMAERDAEEERQHHWEYDQGRQCGEALKEMSTIRRDMLSAIKKATRGKKSASAIRRAKEALRDTIESAADELCDLRRKVKELRSYNNSEAFKDGLANA